MNMKMKTLMEFSSKSKVRKISYLRSGLKLKMSMTASCRVSKHILRIIMTSISKKSGAIIVVILSKTTRSKTISKSTKKTDIIHIIKSLLLSFLFKLYIISSTHIQYNNNKNSNKAV